MKAALKIFFSVLILCSLSNHAQEKGKRFYLVDSLNYKDLSPKDKTVLDSILTLYHAEKSDTAAIKYIVYLTDNLQDTKLWPKYNELLLQTSKQRTDELFYRKIYANSLLNKGYICNNYYGKILDGLDYYQRALDILKSSNDKKGIAMALNNIGAIYNNKGQIEIALKYYNESLSRQLEIKDKKGIAYSYSNIALILRDKGDIPKSIDYYLKSLKIREQIDDQKGIASCYNELGDIYMSQDNFREARIYFEKSIKIYKSISDKSGMAKCYYNLAQTCIANKEFDEAIVYLNKSLELSNEANDWHSKAKALNALGNAYFSFGKKDIAQNYFEKSFKIRGENGDKNGLSYSYISLAGILLENNNKEKALEYGKKALAISRDLKFPKNIQNAAHLLHKIYKQQNKYKESLEMAELYYTMRDSVTNEENKEQTLKKDLEYGFEKKENKLKADQEIKNTLNTEEKRQQRIILIFVSIGFLFVVALAIFIFRSLQVNKKKNIIITEQKQEVENQRDLIEKQKQIVEEHQKEVLDSINYAKRIQQAHLPTERYIDKSIERLKNT